MHGKQRQLSQRGEKAEPRQAWIAAREAIARFVDGSAERLQGWLDEIAERDGPKAAFQCVVDLLEFHCPKLARQENIIEENGPIEIRWLNAKY